MAENEFTERKLLYFVNCSVSKIMNDLKKSLKMEFKKKKKILPKYVLLNLYS